MRINYSIIKKEMVTFADTLRIAEILYQCAVLGPGIRSVLWLQGCLRHCKGCIGNEYRPIDGGREISLDEVAHNILKQKNIEGVTFSGGEPMLQAQALYALILRIKEKRDLSFCCYTGHTLEELHERGAAAQKMLLSKLDILIDGPYILEKHTDLKWRGSYNQKVHLLTDRYRFLQEDLKQRGVFMELHVGKEGSVDWIGIPPQDFLSRLRQGLLKKKIHLKEDLDEPLTKEKQS